MNNKRLYSALSAATSLIGIGMLLGYSLANGTSKTPLWIGGLLILLGAVTLGMTISSRSVTDIVENTKKKK
ncbi:MAG: hypothetical protein ACR2FM_03605 [Candidatus Saccharimonadales bacterium]